MLIKPVVCFFNERILAALKDVKPICMYPLDANVVVIEAWAGNRSRELMVRAIRR